MLGRGGGEKERPGLGGPRNGGSEWARGGSFGGFGCPPSKRIAIKGVQSKKGSK